MTMTAKRLAELDAVMAKATAGGWQQYADDHLIIVNGEGSSLGEMSAGDPYIPESEQAANAAAIVALHNDYPDLRAMIDEQAATIARQAEALREIVGLVVEAIDLERIGAVVALDAIADVAHATLKGAA